METDKIINMNFKFELKDRCYYTVGLLIFLFFKQFQFNTTSYLINVIKALNKCDYSIYFQNN